MLLALVVALAVSSPSADDPITPFADIPGVTLVTYDVGGRSAASVRRSMDAVRPTDANDGERVDGLSGWKFDWRWRRDASGKCSTTPEDVVFSATVTVPRLADDKVPRSFRAQFDRYMISLLAHEDWHVRNAWQHRGDIVAAINGATCDTADAAAKAAVKAIGARDRAYDASTKHGATTVQPFS